ncbi:succinylglutamate desuccinylase/aspartoacylase family protein [Kordiimonas sediminis]|nr:succinylglutamate desuccinylase/aspartoacylase family protein [Kordiimonas sediminis]
MTQTTKTRDAFKIGTESVKPGTRKTVHLPVSTSHDLSSISLPVHVIHGRRPGPTVFVSGAVHGDEIIGVEVIRRLLNTKNIDGLRGTLLAVPVVNSFGFANHSRYLPDRRDLNRCFPGNTTGSLAGRLAHIFMKEVVERCDVGIDIHSAAIHRENLPQIRVTPSSLNTMKLAQAFEAPLILTSALKEGSLRKAAHQKKVDILLFEAGEALRFDEFAVRIGFSGVMKVLRALEMIPKSKAPKHKINPILSTSSFWVRSPAGGLLRTYRSLGDVVEKGDLLGLLSDTMGKVETEINATEAGVIIGRTNLPMVHEGDAIFHVAKVAKQTADHVSLEELEEGLHREPLFDEDEII